MGVKIVVYATSDMTPEVEAKVKIVSMTITFGDREYVTGICCRNGRKSGLWHW